MKKTICIILAVTLLFCSAACGKAPETTGTEKSEAKIDVDLTELSSTMVYSEVYNMLTEPDKYVGKTVKMNGQFAVYHDDSTGNNYFACIIADATACCQQGLEFKLKKEAVYPDDYPQKGTEITVVGTFGTYMENENMYCELSNAEMTV